TDLPAVEVDELAAAMNPVEIEAGTELITHGKDGHIIYFVEQGEADVLTDDGEVAHTLGTGDTFGEIAILLTGQRTATVVARTQPLRYQHDQLRQRPKDELSRWPEERPG